MPRLDEAEVLVQGQRLTNWTRYRIDSDLLTPADGFDMTITMGGKHDDTTIAERQRIVELTSPGQPMRVQIDGHLQMDGVIDDQEVNASEKTGTMIRIVGRDRAAFLVDASVSLHVQVQNERMVVRRRPVRVGPLEYQTDGVRATRFDEDGNIVEAEGTARRFEIFGDPRGLISPNARTPFGTFATLPQELEIERITERIVENVTLPELVRAVVEPWRIPVVTQGVEARDILTGRRSRDRAGHRRRLARAHGVPEESISRNILRRNARGEGSVADLANVTDTDDRSRGDYANNLDPNEIERLRPRDARPRPGEKVWDFLLRHVQRFGLMMWMSPDGKLVLSSPNYGDDPTFRIIRRYRNRSDDPNNVRQGTRKRSSGNRFSECTVYGRAPGGNVVRSRFQATAYDEDFPYYKPLTVHDQSIRDEDEAQRRAQRELNKRQIKGDILRYNMSGHGQRFLYATDTIGKVIDEVTNIDEDYYVLKRTFTKDPDQGTGTQLTLIPKGALVL